MVDIRDELEAVPSNALVGELIMREQLNADSVHPRVGTGWACVVREGSESVRLSEGFDLCIVLVVLNAFKGPEVEL